MLQPAEIADRLRRASPAFCATWHCHAGRVAGGLWGALLPSPMAVHADFLTLHGLARSRGWPGLFFAMPTDDEAGIAFAAAVHAAAQGDPGAACDIVDAGRDLEAWAVHAGGAGMASSRRRMALLCTAPLEESAAPAGPGAFDRGLLLAASLGHPAGACLHLVAAGRAALSRLEDEAAGACRRAAVPSICLWRATCVAAVLDGLGTIPCGVPENDSPQGWAAQRPGPVLLAAAPAWIRASWRAAHSRDGVWHPGRLIDVAGASEDGRGWQERADQAWRWWLRQPSGPDLSGLALV